MKLATWKAMIEWREVHEIVSRFPNGQIRKCRALGKFIHRDNVAKLDPEKYETSSLSTSITKDRQEIELEEFVL